MTSEKNDFTQGSILKKLALFMLPILGALVLQAAYGAVDLLVVGRFGSTSGLSAVSTGSQVLNLVTFVVIQFATAITILIARYLGEKKPERIGSVIGGGVIVFAAISIVLFFLMVVFAHPIAVLMQAPAEAVDLTTSYVRICGSGIFFIVAYNLMAAIFRGLGDSKSPLLFVLVACIVNIVGDLILVAGFGLNVAGAAIATVFGQFCGMVFCLCILFFKNNEVKVSFKHFKLNGSTLKSIYVVGFPSVIMQSIGSVMIIGLNAILAVSEAAVTVLGIYYKLQSFVFMPCFGLNQGVMPIIGYNYGARKKKRMYSALKRGIIIGVIIMAVGTILMWTIPEQLIAMFGGTQDIMDIGVPAFRIISLCFIPAAAGIIFTTLFQAVGKGLRSLIMSFCRQLVLILPIAWVLSMVFDYTAVWYAFPIAEFFSLMLAIAFFVNLTKGDFKSLDQKIE